MYILDVYIFLNLLLYTKSNIPYILSSILLFKLKNTSWKSL